MGVRERFVRYNAAKPCGTNLLPLDAAITIPHNVRHASLQGCDCLDLNSDSQNHVALRTSLPAMVQIHITCGSGVDQFRWERFHQNRRKGDNGPIHTAC